MSLDAEVVPLAGSASPGRRVTIRRSWLRAKHWLLLLISIALSTTIFYLWSEHGASVWLVLGTLFVLSWDYNVGVAFVNATTIQADPGGVRVSHGPMPSLIARKRSFERAKLKQLFAIEFGSLYAVRAELSDGSHADLVAPLVSAEQALFVEQQLESVLGIRDYAVLGELGQPEPLHVAGEPVPGAKSGAGIAILLPILLVGGVLFFFLFAASAELEGELVASGEVGNFRFAPDDCVSGEREGFGGAELRSSKDRGHVIRVVKDPVKGTVVVLTGGGPNHVFEARNCKQFIASVERTSTNINDIWVVEGGITLDCPGLTGAISFAGCH
jgi:hypothetical protein